MGVGQADSFSFNVDLDDGAAGAFGTLTITESGDDLDFAITIDTSTLGLSSDIHEFYFNLDGAFTGLAITASNTPDSAYALASPATEAGGAGASFEHEVNFGNGAGNGTLQYATFTLSADQALTLASLNQPSSSNNAGDLLFALHVQSTGLDGEGSEAVGVPDGGFDPPIPEPGTLLLIGSGLVGLGLSSRRRA